MKKMRAAFTLIHISISILLFVNGCKNNFSEIEKIKSDLIGESVPGWNFDYLSEFKDFKILKKTEGVEWLEYDADLKLIDETDNKKINISVKIVYEKKYGVMLFRKVELKNRTYINKAPQGKWNTIYVLNDCTYKIMNSDQKFWLRDPCTGNQFKLGGKDGESTWGAKCDSVMIMSRENKDILLSFVYTQNVIRLN